MMFGLLDSPKGYYNPNTIVSHSPHMNSPDSKSSDSVNTDDRFEAVASFQLVWSNHESGSRKKLSIWRPVIPQGRVYFGDIAIQGYVVPLIHSVCIFTYTV